MGAETCSETIVQNVKVLAVDQTAASDKNEPVVVRAVTLEVTPEDAEKLVLAKQRGAIQLALRNPLDDRWPSEARRGTARRRAPAPAAAGRPRREDGRRRRRRGHGDPRHRRSTRRFRSRGG